MADRRRTRRRKEVIASGNMYQLQTKGKFGVKINSPTAPCMVLCNIVEDTSLHNGELQVYVKSTSICLMFHIITGTDAIPDLDLEFRQRIRGPTLTSRVFQ